MRAFILLLLCFTLWKPFSFAVPTWTSREAVVPRVLTPDVAWDKTSLSVLGQRIFIQGGEFHPFRLPSKDLWRDVLQKMHAGGLNTVSIYTHWDQVNPSPGVFDFDGFRDLAAFLDVAQETGIWVIVRPGPYINAETTGGGFPGWVTTLKGDLRSNATDYEEAWTPYIQEICRITKPYQVNYGGPVILMQVENELTQTEVTNKYFDQIKKVMVDSGIVVPLTFNDWGPDYYFNDKPNAPDIYGLDSYPQSFDCSRPDFWKPVVDTYHQYHLNAIQGGAFDPWGPAAPGYEKCRTLTGSDFESVFYKGLWAQNVKMLSIYMIYGGTNWGNLAFPGVYTSYDYGAAITESRELTDKFAELKRQSLFLRSVRDFVDTDVISTDNTTSSYTVHLRNPTTGASFYVVRQTNSTAVSNVTLSMSIDTKAGSVSLPPVSLTGRESKVVSADLAIGKSTYLKYTTASILYAGTIGSRDVVFLHDRLGDHSTTSFVTSCNSASSSGPAEFTSSSNGSTLDITTSTSGLSALAVSKSLLVLYADADTAGTFWNPLIPSKSKFENFYSFGTNDTVLVGGPYLVRNASISGATLEIQGDLDATKSTTLTVFAPSHITQLKWNGVSVELDNSSSLVPFGALVGTVTPSVAAISLPALIDWSYKDSLPEAELSFDDSKWTQIKTGKLNNPYPPFYGDLWLYACEYGFCEGANLWRGAFEVGADKPTAVNLSLSGGEAFAGSAWLNGHFLGTSFGNSTNNLNIVSSTNQTFEFPADSLVSGTNVVTVVIDNMGQDEGNNEPKHPRGIQGYSLVGGGDFKSWKVQGKIGGNSDFPDKTRSVTNEGGFFAEREGWHLPGFPTATWEKRSPTQGLATAGVGFFSTTVELDIPAGLDVPLSIVYDGLDTGGSNSTAFRSLLFVNGWQFGRFVSNLGPQTIFPIPEGILDHRGNNTIGVLLWALGSNGASIKGLSITSGGVYAGGVGPVSSDNPSWSPRANS
ncbi:hypothetical protein RQP46_004725 [Phenoliferia psychrophenolica]